MVKLVRAVREYESNDGKIFNSKKDAVAHELGQGVKVLLKMTHADIDGLMRGEDPEGRIGAMRTVIREYVEAQKVAGIIPRRVRTKKAGNGVQLDEQYA